MRVKGRARVVNVVRVLYGECSEERVLRGESDVQ